MEEKKKTIRLIEYESINNTLCDKVCINDYAKMSERRSNAGLKYQAAKICRSTNFTQNAYRA
jgi:hypothetical protein